MEDLVLVGGGGHCKSVIDVIRNEGKFNILGILDAQLPIGSRVLDVQVLGDDSMLPEIMTKCNNYHVTVGQLKSNQVRKRIASILIESGVSLPNIFSRGAMVSRYSEFGKGITVMHRATIQAASKIGDFTIVNNHALIEHDVQIGNLCHIATGAIINGNAQIGDDVFVGSGAVVVQGAKIPSGSFIKANQIVK